MGGDGSDLHIIDDIVTYYAATHADTPPPAVTQGVLNGSNNTVDLMDAWEGGGHVFIVGGEHIFHRLPSGTWADEALPPEAFTIDSNPGLHSVFGFDDGTIYAVGNKGLVVKRSGPPSAGYPRRARAARWTRSSSPSS